MRLGVVSDSHGHVSHTLPAIEMLRSLEVDQVLHCGDIGSSGVVALFADWPTHFVFGNCDYDQLSLQQAIETAGQSCHGQFGQLEIEGRQIALLHSHEQARFDQTLRSGQWDLVCYGHTHVAAIDRYGATLALNPGALYRANPHSLAIVELPSLEPHIVTL